VTDRGRVAGQPGHLGDRVAALVDGQLGHVERERVFAHLTRCAACRAEAGEQRALKSRLHLDVPAPGGLEGRLLAVGAAEAPAWPGGGAGPQPLSVAQPLPLAQPLPVPRRRTSGAVGVVLLVGASLGGALLADPADPPRRDPGLPDLVVEHATAATHVPLPDPAVVGAAWSATAPGGVQSVGLVVRGR
jgi:anti-sigma factor RsiW